MPRNILVIDDEPDTRDCLAVMLSLEGYSVRTAASRDDALTMLCASIPDAIFLDIKMPGMTVEKFVANVRRVFPQPSLILMSAVFKVDEKAKELKLRNYLPKPFTYTDIIEALASCFDDNG